MAAILQRWQSWVLVQWWYSPQSLTFSLSGSSQNMLAGLCLKRLMGHGVRGWLSETTMSKQKGKQNPRGVWLSGIMECHWRVLHRRVKWSYTSFSKAHRQSMGFQTSWVFCQFPVNKDTWRWELSCFPFDLGSVWVIGIFGQSNNQKAPNAEGTVPFPALVFYNSIMINRALYDSSWVTDLEQFFEGDVVI